MGYDDDDVDRLVTQARDLGFELVQIDPARQIHSAEDVTLVNPTGSTIGFLLKDVTTGRHHFVPVDGRLAPSPGSGTGEGPEPPAAPVVVFWPFCPAHHDEPFGGSLVDGAWHGRQHATMNEALSEAGDHDATTGHAAVVRRYFEA